MRRFGFVWYAAIAGAALWSMSQLVAARQSVGSIISGQVVDATTGGAVEGATVTVSPDRGRTLLARAPASDGGQFRLTGLGRGHYMVRAELGGYLGGTYGQDFSDEVGELIDVDGDNGAANVVLPLWKAASIAGDVVDGDVKPIGGIRVMAVRRIFAYGHVVFEPVTGATTDEHGAYRISGLEAGHYLVALRATDSTQAVIFPDSVSAAGAEVIALSPGRDRAGIRFRVATKGLPRGSISGRLLAGPAGTPIVLLADEADNFVDVPQMRSQTDRGNAYRFVGVRPGHYIVRAVVKSYVGTTPTSGYTQNRVAEARVTVADAEVKAPLLNVFAPAVTGRIGINGQAARPPISDFQVCAQRTDGRALEPMAVPVCYPVSADGRFSATGLPAAKYGFLVDSIGPWHLQAVKVQDRLVQNDIIEVTSQGVSDVSVVMTDQPRQTLSGNVVDSRGDARSAASVYLFPADAGFLDAFSWSFRVQTHRSDTSGHYALQVVAGDYLVVATASSMAGYYWMGRPVFEALGPLGERVTVKDGESVTKDLHVNQPPRWQ